MSFKQIGEHTYININYNCPVDIEVMHKHVTYTMAMTFGSVLAVEKDLDCCISQIIKESSGEDLDDNFTMAKNVIESVIYRTLNAKKSVISLSSTKKLVEDMGDKVASFICVSLLISFLYPRKFSKIAESLDAR